MEQCEAHFSGIAVVGLGLIGGSVAKAAAQKLRLPVYGCDLSQQVLEQAMGEGVLADVLTPHNASACGLVLLALYPQAAVSWLGANAGWFNPGTVVVDLCGVKRAVEPLAELARSHGLTYVGGHPMAGTEKTGYIHSRAELFAGASMILTPPPDTDPKTLHRLEGFFIGLGFGRIQHATPEEHDRIIAYTSQLSHLLSSAYIKSPTARMQMGFSAGSFRDMTRVAWLNEEMWTELFLDNADYLAQEAEGLAYRILEYADAVRQKDGSRLRAMLAEGKALKEKVEEEAKCNSQSPSK